MVVLLLVLAGSIAEQKKPRGGENVSNRFGFRFSSLDAFSPYSFCTEGVMGGETPDGSFLQLKV